MNRFQHDNIDPKPEPAHRKRVLTQKNGIGHKRRTEAIKKKKSTKA